MVFELTNTQQASQDFIQPELTIFSVSIELKFSAALTHNVESSLLVKKQVPFILIRRGKF